MENENQVKNLVNNSINKLPAVEVWDRSFKRRGHVILVAGFEERCKLVSTYIPDKSKGIIGRISIIKYLPRMKENEKGMKCIKETLFEKGYEENDISLFTFNRLGPASFRKNIERNVIKAIKADKEVLYIDISGMSKLAILVILDLALKHKIPSQMLYAEANLYHPTKENYEREKMKYTTGKAFLEFLCHGIEKTLILPEFFGFQNVSFPNLLVSFLGFNYRLFSSILNAIHLEQIVQIAPVPHLAENQWRKDAVFEINGGITSSPAQEMELSAFDYKEVLIGIEELFSRYKYTHNIIIAPLGSKLQAIAVKLFHYSHPETQIIYVPPQKFEADLYTEGVKEIHVINWTDLNKVYACCEVLKNPYKILFQIQNAIGNCKS
jgi:hypothetical protein